MSNIVLYGTDISPPVRACKLVLKALDLPYQYKNVDLLKGEHQSEEFLKKNPQHTVPLLDDNGLIISDSHAIVCYLVDKYAKSDELYPKNLGKRALVNQRLYFEATVLFMSLKNVCAPYFLRNVTNVPQEKIDNVEQGYKHLENFLTSDLYVVGDTLTIADLCCAATVSSLPGVLELDPVKYPKITAWLERLSQLPYYKEENDLGAEQFISHLKGALTIV
ncbi:glutathione S-transferase 1-like [Drosophila tropicalis]|uniref:glutathione S-transferase 1-like n=1 Tax=Drosophila tropicalis TaxID=46794 RepID=UPI0035AB7B4F